MLKLLCSILLAIFVSDAGAAPVSAKPGSVINYLYFDKLKTATGSVTPPGEKPIPIPSGNCTSQAKVWTQGAHTCSGVTGPTTNNALKSVSSTNANSGTGNFVCNAASNSYTFVSAGSTCVPPTCSSQLKSWTQGAVSCSASTGTTSNSVTKAVASTNGNTGTGNFTCNSATDSYTIVSAGSNCTMPPPTSCSSQVKSWTQGGNICSSSTGTTADGTTKAVASTNGNTGTGNFTCNSATDSYAFVSAGSNCTPPPPTTCTSQTKYWSQAGVTCSATTGETSDGIQQALASTNGNTGIGIYTCNASSNTYGFTAAGSSCTPPESLQAGGFATVSRSTNSGCAITATGALKCWGDVAGYLSPTLVDAGTTYKGLLGMFALTTTGVLKSMNTQANPTLSIVDPGVSYKSLPVRGSDSFFAITDTGDLKAWGYGHLGDGRLRNNTQAVSPNAPIIIDSGTKYITISASGGGFGAYYENICGLTSTGVLKCWGSTNSAAFNFAPRKLVPTVLDPGVTYKALEVSTAVSCGITTAGVLKCWGENGYKETSSNGNQQAVQYGIGYVGDGTSAINQNRANVRPNPVVIDSGTTYDRLAHSSYGGSDEHNCAITTTDVLKCWGRNGTVGALDGLVGDGSGQVRLSPIVIDNGIKYKDVWVGYWGTCGITLTGVLKCWGENYSFGSQLLIAAPDGVAQSVARRPITTPTIIDPGNTYKGFGHFTNGTRNACGITTTGLLKCWGMIVGDGTNLTRLTPTPIDAASSY